MLERPPGLRGREWQQIRDLHSYLYRLSEHLGVLLEEKLPGEGEQEEEQTPRALFQSIRGLIAGAEDIQGSFQNAFLPKLLALFLEQTDFEIYRRKAEEEQKALSEELHAADEALAQRTAALEQHRQQTADYVTESGEAVGFAFRLWQSGRAELWGSFPVQAVKDTPLVLPLPFALKKALAFVQGLEFDALSVTDCLSLSPRSSGTATVTVLLLGEKEEEE